ncbi:MAG: homoserine dehydrogenase [Bacteroidetes bacterium]|jgi:homoserine dehydrogenase|nr:homoserine dehydrogenase [Bacteroidota bacterium]MDF2453145.1 homoserine dehydrogenase [Bacteroidota bacterium]
MSKKLKIGLFGFGCVGQGLYHVLNNSTGFKADIIKIAVKDKNKTRTVGSDLITYDKWEILNNPEIDVVVELIDDAEEAFHIVSEALRRGKHVVTANKKLLATHLEELYCLQKENNVSLLYEASACGSIPIIRSLEEYFDNEELEKVSGIFNGTSNYILSKTINEKLSYGEALKQAQEKGFAETDPTNDVEGFDPKFKAIIIALHAFGLIIKPENVLNIGITTLDEHDIRYASEKGYKIKLTPVIQRLEGNQVSVFVAPRFIKEQDQLFNVENEFNGVVVEGKFSGEQFLQGRGAGSLPTGAAVLSDISALSHGYRYEFKKYLQKNAPVFTNDVLVHLYIRYNREEDLNHLFFDEVNEKYTGSTYHYIVGKINLKKIIEAREFILTHNLFIALVDEKVTLDRTVNNKEIVEELQMVG